jgi:molybdopterin-guanine dinucleotide biosynthesis protein A
MEAKAEHAAQDATLAIVAGGGGRRLGGVAKGLLTLEGRPLIDRILDLRTRFAETLLVADNPGAYNAYGLRSVPDLVEGRGAPGGVHAALGAARTPWVLAVGCDMPFVTWQVAQMILEARAPEVDLVCFEIDGRFEPLLAVYRSSLARSWGLRLGENPSFGGIFSGFRTRVLPKSRLEEVDPDLRSVVSINGPDDLARWGVQLPAT